MNKDKIETVFQILVNLDGEEILQVIKLFNIGMLSSLNAIVAAEIMDKVGELNIGGKR